MRGGDSVSTTDTPSTAVDSAPDPYLAVQQSAEFAGLRRALRNFVFPMTVAFFLWYALYVLLSAYARGFMGTKVVGNINIALVFGLLQFVSTFLIAWLYARYTERRVDPVADRLKVQVEDDAMNSHGGGAS